MVLNQLINLSDARKSFKYKISEITTYEEQAEGTVLYALVKATEQN